MHKRSASIYIEFNWCILLVLTRCLWNHGSVNIRFVPLNIHVYMIPLIYIHIYIYGMCTEAREMGLLFLLSHPVGKDREDTALCNSPMRRVKLLSLSLSIVSVMLSMPSVCIEFLSMVQEFVWVVVVLGESDKRVTRCVCTAAVYTHFAWDQSRRIPFHEFNHTGFVLTDAHALFQRYSLYNDEANAISRIPNTDHVRN